MNRHERRAALPMLDRLYAAIPRVACKGLCVSSCGPIAMSELEYHRIQAKAGKPPARGADGRCNMLRDGRCTVYAIRPVICRLFGVVESLPCEHGCVPDQRLPHEAGFVYLDAAQRIGGPEKTGDPELLEAVRRALRDG